MSDKFTVYMHIFPDGKRYIGMTSNLETRFSNGKGYRGNVNFCEAVAKYGWDNIKHIIVKSDLNRSEASQLERELIAKYRSNELNFGFNKTKGGEIHKKIAEFNPLIIGEKIHTIRKSKKITLSELAKSSNVCKASICLYEHGKRTPSKNTVIQLAKALDIEPDVLLDDERSIEP